MQTPHMGPAPPSSRLPYGIWAAVLVFAGAALLGCTVAATSPPTYTFAFEAPAGEHEADLTVAIVSPAFRIDGNSTHSESQLTTRLFPGISGSSASVVEAMAEDYIQSLRRDLEALFASQGFRTTGPYMSRDQMTYPEREEADFALVPVIDITVADVVTRRARASDFMLGVVRGTLTITADMELDLYEPLSWEKMWIKRLDVVEETAVAYQYKYQSNGTVGADERPQVLADALSKSYTAMLEQAFAYLDPQELEALGVKAKEVREKTRF